MGVETADAVTVAVAATTTAVAKTAAGHRPPQGPRPTVARPRLDPAAISAARAAPMIAPAAAIAVTTVVDRQGVAATVRAGMATATPIAAPR